MAIQVDWNAQLIIGLRMANAKIVRKALEEGADTQKLSFVSKFGYVTPLEWAVFKSDANSVKALLDNNASVVRTAPSGKRLDARVIAENIAHANPSNPNCQKVAALLNTVQHDRVFSSELKSTTVNTVPRPGMR